MAYDSIVARLERYRDLHLADYYSNAVLEKDRTAAFHRAQAYSHAIEMIRESITAEDGLGDALHEYMQRLLLRAKEFGYHREEPA